MGRGVRWRAQRFALAVYRRLPVSARRAVVRTLSPTYTAGSIVLIERDDGHVLLIRQTYRNGWGLPGGLLAKGEDPEAAAHREVREEVGLTIEMLGGAALVMDVTPRRLDFVFLARPAPGHDAEVAAPSSPELAEARWFPRSELPSLQHETRTAIAALERRELMPFLSGVHPVATGVAVAGGPAGEGDQPPAASPRT